jgi:hypothetical protein
MEAVEATCIFAIGVVALAMSSGCWPIHRPPRRNHLEE